MVYHQPYGTLIPISTVATREGVLYYRCSLRALEVHKAALYRRQQTGKVLLDFTCLCCTIYSSMKWFCGFVLN